MTMTAMMPVYRPNFNVSTIVRAKNPPIINKSPWAKWRRRIEAKINEYPRATRA
jgi:hypothetical protein